MISVDNSTDFTYPERYSGMPSITDEINSANVRVWSLPVDVTDTLKTQETVTAMKSENCGNGCCINLLDSFWEFIRCVVELSFDLNHSGVTPFQLLFWWLF